MGIVLLRGLDPGGGKALFRSKQIVLAGGAIGNARLLLNSGFGKDLPQIGKGFFCHPPVHELRGL